MNASNYLDIFKMTSFSNEPTKEYELGVFII
jgi:hypothetical protein